MILLVIFLLSFIGFRLNQDRFGLQTLMLCFILTFAIGGGPLPGLLLNHLQVYPQLLSPSWGKKNAIVVLGGGLSKDGEENRTSPLAVAREFEAVRQYHSCKLSGAQCHVLTSGGDPSKSAAAEAEVMAKELKSAGVDEADLTVENKSNNTFQNAQYSSALLHGGNFDRTVLVTSGLHMRRALLYFTHFLVAAVPAPADRFVAKYTFFPNSLNFSLMDFCMHEELGIARFYIYDFLGINTPAETRH